MSGVTVVTVAGPWIAPNPPSWWDSSSLFPADTDSKAWAL
jgi:hypothetical protein